MSANKEFVRQFFNMKKGEPTIVNVGGQFRFNNMPSDIQVKVKERLAEKDPIIKELAEKKAVGIIIDGKQVTQQWADELDLEKPDIPRSDGVDIKKLIKAREKDLEKTEVEKLYEDGKTPDEESLEEAKKKDEEKKEEIETPKFTRKELESMLESNGFKKFRIWAKETCGVTGRSGEGIIKDILSGKKEL